MTQRLRTSFAFNALVPRAVAAVLAHLVAAAFYVSSDRRRVARDDVTAVTRRTGVSALEVYRALLARARSTVFDHRPAAFMLSAPSAASLARSSASQRSIIVAWLHITAPAGVAYAVGRVASPYSIVGGDWLFDETLTPAMRPLAQARLKLVERSGGVWIRRGNATQELSQSLRAKRPVLMAFDSPGQQQVELAGRAAWLARGTGRLAAEHEADVFLARVTWRRTKAVVELEGPFCASTDDASGSALTARLAAEASRIYLQAPASVQVNPLLWMSPQARTELT